MLQLIIKSNSGFVKRTTVITNERGAHLSINIYEGTIGGIPFLNEGIN
jgi:hypothetical protein